VFLLVGVRYSKQPDTDSIDERSSAINVALMDTDPQVRNAYIEAESLTQFTFTVGHEPFW
jgi:hypothetical protein